jgi:hypothetical protein
MSTHLHAEIIRARQQEIADRSIHAHDLQDVRLSAGRRIPRIRHRVGRTMVAVGVCAAATTLVTVGGANGNPRPVQPQRHVSARQLADDLRKWEAKDFVPTQCTDGGTKLVNFMSHRSAFVSW